MEKKEGESVSLLAAIVAYYYGHEVELSPTSLLILLPPTLELILSVYQSVKPNASGMAVEGIRNLGERNEWVLIWRPITTSPGLTDYLLPFLAIKPPARYPSPSTYSLLVCLICPRVRRRLMQLLAPMEMMIMDLKHPVTLYYLLNIIGIGWA